MQKRAHPRRLNRDRRIDQDLLRAFLAWNSRSSYQIPTIQRFVDGGGGGGGRGLPAAIDVTQT